MNEGIKNNTKRKIKAIEAMLTENQNEMSQEEIDEALDLLDSLYELVKLFE